MLSRTVGPARRHLALCWTSPNCSERTFQAMQTARGLAFFGERAPSWHSCLNERSNNGQWLQKTDKSPSSAGTSPLSYVASVGRNNIWRQGHKLRSHVQQAAYCYNGGQAGKYNKRSSTNGRGGGGWTETSKFSQGIDRLSGFSSANAGGRQLRDDNSPRQVSRQHSEHEDYGAPSREAASASASLEGSEVSQKWQLFPPQQSGQQQQQPPVERRRRQPPPPLPLNFPQDPVTLSQEQNPADDTAVVDQMPQYPQSDARHQRSTKGTGAFQQVQTAARPASASTADTIPLDQATARSDDHFFEPDSTFEALGLHPQVVAALQRAGLPRPSRVQVSSCHRRVLPIAAASFAPLDIA